MIESKMKVKNNPDQEYECPLCGEYLNLNRDGTMTNKNTGEFIYVYTCKECNQAFALDNDDLIKLIPYDAEMKKIENKCKGCGKIENYNEKGLFLLNVDNAYAAYYEFYCFDCAIPILQKWADKNLKKKTKITKENVHEIYEIYDFTKNNEMLEQLNKNPQKYKETMDKVKEQFDNQK